MFPLPSKLQKLKFLFFPFVSFDSDVLPVSFIMDINFSYASHSMIVTEVLVCPTNIV